MTTSAKESATADPVSPSGGMPPTAHQVRTAGQTRLISLAVWSSVVLGLSLQLTAFTSNRSLWIDEAMLARNILHRSFNELHQPLSDDQAAPPGYLALAKTAVLLGGPSEHTFRVPSLLAGFAALLCLVLLTRRHLGMREAAAAGALVACSPALVYYSAEAKQYALDAFTATTLLYLCLNLRERRSTASAAGLALAGAVALWLSHPSVFVLASLGALLAWEAAAGRRKAEILQVVVIGLAWTASAALLYWVHLRAAADNRALSEFWQHGFVPASPLAAIVWAWGRYWLLFTGPFGDPAGYLLGWLFAVGLLTLSIRRRDWAWIVAGPFVVALIASAARVYPFGAEGGGVPNSRLMLFTLPFAVLGCVHGWRAVADRNTLLTVTLAIAILLPSLRLSAELARSEVEALRPLLAQMRDELRTGDHVYVYAGAVPAFSVYAIDFGYLRTHDVNIVRDSARTRAGRIVEPSDYEKELEAFAGCGRVWLVHAHDSARPTLNARGSALTDEERIRVAATHYATELTRFVAAGASVTLFSFDRRPWEPHDGDQRNGRWNGCGPAHPSAVRWQDREDAEDIRHHLLA